ncbi:uncharacterized protein LOC128163085 isoform X3 [Crassostrea angulata]|uniref:uncharacterized protein LOC128163085 isoform X3 n=1 Tax=Magallana angulata TaxID=2784310 RepID=UPI0022B1F7C9|nr:uncharacterized protein LOC128163085 isoform X3 [Crassostrea angulata]
MSVDNCFRKKGKFVSKKDFIHSKIRQDNIVKARNQPIYQTVIESDHNYASKFTEKSSTSDHDEAFTHHLHPDYLEDSFQFDRLKPLNFYRFIIDLKLFIDNLFCQVCDNDIYLKNALGVFPSGVCGHVVITCLVCKHVNKVAMGKTHQEQQKPGPKIFDVNSKIGSAMYHTGIGPTQVNNFLSTLNLPSINVKTLRRRCEEIGEELENLAENSVKDALKEEVKCTVTEVRRNVIDVPEESLAVSTDMHVNSDEDDYKDVAEVRRNGNDVPEESLAVSTDNMHVNFDEDDYKDVAEVRRNGNDVPEESLAVSTDNMHVNFDEDDYKDVAEVRRNEIDVPEESLAVSTDNMHANFDEDDYNDVAGDERLPSRESTSKQHKKKTTAFEKNVIRNVDKDSQGSVQQSDTSMGITVSADGTFQKRGSGRCYNSLSGAASLIGLKTGKVVGFSSRLKRCRKCMVAKKSNRTPIKHKCRKNWVGSAKAMEPDMIVEMLQHAKSSDAPVATLIGDDDCTAFKRAREEVNSTIEKVSDKNHMKKNLSNKLYKLKTKYPKELSVKTINALLKSFSYMIAQNTGNIYAIKENLESVVLHQFGEHDDCGNWCSFKGNPTGKHKNLPWGLDLSNNSLKNDLMSIFKTLDAEKLSKLGSSNVNESFNNILRSKAPKDKHYSESSSLAHRLSAAVCQKNEGYDYVAKVHQNLGLSPGNSTVSRANIMNKEVKRKKIMCKEKKYKRRRILLKVERLEETKTCEVREGDTYATDIMEKSAADLCTEEIPAVERKPQTCICFDLETTGLSRHSSIVQIAASNGSSSFSRYITPLSCNISSEASKVTGITFDGKTMCNQGKEVIHHHPVNAFLDFISFLSENGKGVYLAAHNCRNFDAVILFNQLHLYNLWGEFCKTVIGFSDTLPMFKIMYPNFLKNYKQETLVESLLNVTYDAHNAEKDVEVLQRLVFEKGNVEILISEQCFFYSSQLSPKGVVPTKHSLSSLVSKTVISKHICGKIQKAGLGYMHLLLAFKRGGFDGLQLLLGEKNEDAKVRVTRCMKVIENIAAHFRAEFQEE